MIHFKYLLQKMVKCSRNKTNTQFSEVSQKVKIKIIKILRKETNSKQQEKSVLFGKRDYQYDREKLYQVKLF